MPGKKAAAAKKKAKKAKKATKAPKTPSVFVVPRLEDYDEAGFVESAHGRPIASLAQLWSDYPPQVWYSKGADYWASVTADESGMLGGLTNVKEPDERESIALLKRLQEKSGPAWGRSRCCDCGGGIGRVTRNVLMAFYDKVDLVEQCPAFVETGVRLCNAVRPDAVVGVCCGLQAFAPPAAIYDLVWVQWVTGHLRDDDFVAFLHRCTASLTEHGLIVIKDNASSQDGFVVDVVDHSLSRTTTHLRHLFAVAGLKVIFLKRQTGFPDGMLPVYMWVLGRPDNKLTL